MISLLKKLSKEYPNDADFGNAVRRLLETIKIIEKSTDTSNNTNNETRNTNRPNSDI